jgi:hypothetical protein
MNSKEIKQHILDNPPSCVKEFELKLTQLPEFWDNNFTTPYKLTCKCGNDSGKILGHLLRDYNLSLSKDDDSFITPLGFQCLKCNTITEILDTDIHGYHAESAKIEGGIGSAKYRGVGQRTLHICPKCFSTNFKNIIVGFVYWDFDVMIDEPDLPIQEFFNVFLFYVTCQSCGHISKPVNLGKL